MAEDVKQESGRMLCAGLQAYTQLAFSQARTACLGNGVAHDELKSVNNEDNSPQTCLRASLITI